MDGQFQVGPWLVEPSLNIISGNGTTLHVEPKAMEVLVCLAKHAGEAVRKEQLLQAVWPDTFISDDVLKHCISDLRRVFEDDARKSRVIHTIPKRGYRLVAPVVPAKKTAEFAEQTPASKRITETTRTGTRRVLTWPLVIGGAVLIAVSLIVLKAWRAHAGRVVPIHSLAVLPLQNLSVDPAQEYFSDGMTDALITDLAQIGSLKVISRTSSMQYKQTKKSLPEIAQELNVDGIVEGTVQRSGDRVRITAQLIHAASDEHVWANSYERDLRDIFALQRDIASDVASQIGVRSGSSKQTRPRLVNPNVLDAYTQGMYYLEGRGRGGGDEEERRAAAYFQRAIDLDPNFALAYVGLARAHDILSQGTPEDLAIVKQASEKAVSLDPFSADARVQLGQWRYEMWDWSGAEDDFRRAIVLNPNDGRAHDSLADVLYIYGRLDEGWKEFEIAQEIDPYHDHLAEALYQRGQFDRAIEIRQRIAHRDPEFGYNHYALAMNYAQKRMFKEFATEMGQATALFGLPDVTTRLQHAYAQSGGHGVLTQWAHELEQLAASKRLYLPGALAQLYAALGDKDRSFYWLEEYRQHHDVATADATIFFKTDPWFVSIRSDPRFSDFLRHVGLPE